MNSNFLPIAKIVKQNATWDKKSLDVIFKVQEPLKNFFALN